MEKYLPQKSMHWNDCGGCGHSKNECNCKEEFKGLIDTQKVVITDQNGARTEHTAISEAIETNNKLDSVIVEKDGVKSFRIDGTLNADIDATGLATETKQDAIITAINDKQITVDNQDVLDKMDEVITAINNKNITVDMAATNQILTDIKNQEQTNATALLDVANSIKTELEKKPDQTELVTEVDRIIAAIQAGGSQIDYTTQLNDILAKLQLIADKEDVEIDYTTLLNDLVAKLDTINANIVKLEGQYNQVLADLKTELQAINTNTDTLESKIQELIDKPGYDDTALKQVISDFKLEAKSESDETQVKLDTLNTSILANNTQNENIINLLGNQSNKLDDELNTSQIVDAIGSQNNGVLVAPILDNVVGTNKLLSTTVGATFVKQLTISNQAGATGTVVFGGMTLKDTFRTETYYNVDITGLTYTVNSGGIAIIEVVK